VELPVLDSSASDHSSHSSDIRENRGATLQIRYTPIRHARRLPTIVRTTPSCYARILGTDGKKTLIRMTTDQNDFSIVRFSTDDLPERDRSAIWREHFAPSVFKVEIELPPADTAVKVDMAARSLPGLQLLSGLYTPGRMIRTRRLIAADGNDDFLLRINTSGAATGSAAGRELEYGYGALLTNAAEVHVLDRLSFGGSTVVRIPRPILSALVIDIDDIVMRPISGETGILRLLLGYANTLLTDAPMASPAALRHLAVSHVTDLVALALRATRDAAHIAEGRGVPAVRLHAAKAYVIENSGRQSLSVTDVAKHLGVSSRHVQRLFDGDGTTFSAFLLDCRLANAYRMLCRPQYNHWDIGKIAGYVGFADISYFGRCFRKLYGSAPRDIRRGDGNSNPLN
jgi:AraC-like DNA-binding protein